MWIYSIGSVYVLLRLGVELLAVFSLTYTFFLGKKANLGKNVSVNTQHGPATEIAVETTIPKQGQNLW